MGSYLGRVESETQGTFSLVEKNKFYTEQRKFQRQFYVLSDTTSETLLSIVSTTGIPALGDALESGICIRQQAEEESTVAKHPVTGVQCILYIVTCDFDTDVNIEDEADPTDLTPKVRWYGENEEERLLQDAESTDPIQTVPGDPLFVTHPVARPILEIRRIESNPFDPDTILDYVNRVNLSDFWGAPDGTALMLPMQSEEVDINGTKYVEVTYRIKFNLKEDSENPGNLLGDTWREKVLHHGFTFINTAGNKEVATDDLGNPLTFNLDENGNKLGDGEDPEFVTFSKFATAEFNTLNLGPTF